MTKRQISSLVRAYGRKGLAELAGVAPSTVSRWLTGAKPKPESASKLLELTERKRKPPRELARLPADSLAALGGVGLATAKRWLKTGIPAARLQRIRLQIEREAHAAGAPVVRPKLAAHTNTFFGSYFRGRKTELTYSPPAYLNPITLGDVISALEAAPLANFRHAKEHVQVICELHIDLAADDAGPNSYYKRAMQSEEGGTTFREILSTHNHYGSTKAKRDAIQEMRGLLLSVAQYGASIERVTLTNRRPV